mmetsp:Transcript_495/g.1619  ORF Transcript_495/g.1619 Transcript_495/m.1619 type:complete len:356 (+) Transcript_495:815-1882(+)
MGGVDLLLLLADDGGLRRALGRLRGWLVGRGWLGVGRHRQERARRCAAAVLVVRRAGQVGGGGGGGAPRQLHMRRMLVKQSQELLVLICVLRAGRRGLHRGRHGSAERRRLLRAGGRSGRLGRVRRGPDCRARPPRDRSLLAHRPVYRAVVHLSAAASLAGALQRRADAAAHRRGGAHDGGRRVGGHQRRLHARLVRCVGAGDVLRRPRDRRRAAAAARSDVRERHRRVHLFRVARGGLRGADAAARDRRERHLPPRRGGEGGGAPCTELRAARAVARRRLLGGRGGALHRFPSPARAAAGDALGLTRALIVWLHSHMLAQSTSLEPCDYTIPKRTPKSHARPRAARLPRPVRVL